MLPLELCHYFNLFPLTVTFNSPCLCSYVTLNSPTVRLLYSGPTCPLLSSLMPVLAGTSPGHGPCWLEWRISGSADRAQWEWRDFIETLNATQALAVYTVSICTHVSLYDCLTVTSIWVFVCVYMYMIKMCEHSWERWRDVCQCMALVTTVSGDDFVWLMPDTWLQQLAGTKMNQCKDRQGYSLPEL